MIGALRRVVAAVAAWVSSRPRACRVGDPCRAYSVLGCPVHTIPPRPSRIVSSARLTLVQRQRLTDLQYAMDRYATSGERERMAASYASRVRGLERAERVALALGLLIALVLGAIAAAAVTATGRTVAPYGDPIARPQILAPSAPSLRRAAVEIAGDERVPPRLLSAVVGVESAWRVNARGAKGEVGLMQLMPATARELEVDPFDPHQKLRGGARLLRYHYEREGSWTRALERYNGRGRRARAYAQRVLRAWEASE